MIISRDATRAAINEASFPVSSDLYFETVTVFGLPKKIQIIFLHITYSVKTTQFKLFKTL